MQLTPSLGSGETECPDGTFVAGYTMDAWERWRIVYLAALSLEDIEDIYLFGTMMTGILLIGFALGYRKIQKTGTAVQSLTSLWLKLWEERSALRLRLSIAIWILSRSSSRLYKGKLIILETKMDKMDRESSLQNWNAFTRPKDKTILYFSGSPTQGLGKAVAGIYPGRAMQWDALASSPHPTDIQTLPLPRPLASVLFEPPACQAGLTSAGLVAAGPDGCLLGRIHFPCGYVVCLWCMCFCVAEVFFLFSHCTPQGA